MAGAEVKGNLEVFRGIVDKLVISKNAVNSNSRIRVVMKENGEGITVKGWNLDKLQSGTWAIFRGTPEEYKRGDVVQRGFKVINYTPIEVDASKLAEVQGTVGYIVYRPSPSDDGWLLAVQRENGETIKVKCWNLENPQKGDRMAFRGVQYKYNGEDRFTASHCDRIEAAPAPKTEVQEVQEVRCIVRFADRNNGDAGNGNEFLRAQTADGKQLLVFGRGLHVLKKGDFAVFTGTMRTSGKDLLFNASEWRPIEDSELEVIQGTVKSFISRGKGEGDNSRILAVWAPKKRKEIRVAGLELSALRKDDRAIFRGIMGQYSGEDQLFVRDYTFVGDEEAAMDPLERFLRSGFINGMGEELGKRVFNKFGAHALEVLEKEPERLREVEGIGPKIAKKIADGYAEVEDIVPSMIFMLDMGFGASISEAVCKLHGTQTEKIVRQDPYRLAMEIDGLSFNRVDKIAQKKLSFTPLSYERLRGGAHVALKNAEGEGHVYQSEEDLCNMADEILDINDVEQVKSAIHKMADENDLKVEIIGDKRAVYSAQMYEYECETARMLTERVQEAREDIVPEEEIQKAIEDCECDMGVKLGAEKKAATKCAVNNRVSIITGGPGTGKTTVINCILRVLDALGTTVLCAPTGRAAKRMSEATGRKAGTIHMLIYRDRARDDAIKIDTLIVDEVSMVDIGLMYRLLKWLDPETRLILVGDIDQLPSVGPGNVLHDMIASAAVPVVRLTEVFRQKGESLIIENAQRINRGEDPIMDDSASDFFLVRAGDEQEMDDAVVDLVQRRLPERMHIAGDRASILRNIQVLTPMNGDRTRLNERLQAAMNPAGPSKPDDGSWIKLRLNDKVIQSKNDYHLKVYNGEIGYVVEVNEEARKVKVEFDDERRVEYSGDVLSELQLSYCVTIHKGQGCEFDAVVLALPPRGAQIPKLREWLSRKMLYTAVTRAKKLMVIVGDEKCVSNMVRNDHDDERNTRLDERLEQQNR